MRSTCELLTSDFVELEMTFRKCIVAIATNNNYVVGLSMKSKIPRLVMVIFYLPSEYALCFNMFLDYVS